MQTARDALETLLQLTGLLYWSGALAGLGLCVMPARGRAAQVAQVAPPPPAAEVEAEVEGAPEPLRPIAETNSIWPPSGRRNHPGPWQRIEVGYGWADPWPFPAAARRTGLPTEIVGLGPIILDPDECANVPTRNISRSIS